MKKLLLVALVLFFMGCSPTAVVFADETTPSISISELIGKLKVNTGIGWDFKNKKVVNTNTLKVLEYAPKEAPKNAFLNALTKENLDPSIDIGYTTSDKAVVGFSFEALKLSKYGVEIPILDLVEVRPFVQYSFYHLTSAQAGNIKNSWIAGVTVINVHF
jgi:hypothetical protein